MQLVAIKAFRVLRVLLLVTMVVLCVFGSGIRNIECIIESLGYIIQCLGHTPGSKK
jgi:hypothetical protein